MTDRPQMSAHDSRPKPERTILASVNCGGERNVCLVTPARWRHALLDLVISYPYAGTIRETGQSMTRGALVEVRDAIDRFLAGDMTGTPETPTEPPTPRQDAPGDARPGQHGWTEHNARPALHRAPTSSSLGEVLEHTPGAPLGNRRVSP